jgi:hypothetical protein
MVPFIRINLWLNWTARGPSVFTILKTLVVARGAVPFFAMIQSWGNGGGYRKRYGQSQQTLVKYRSMENFRFQLS